MEFGCWQSSGVRRKLTGTFSRKLPLPKGRRLKASADFPDGQTLEGIAFAARNKPKNLIVFADVISFPLNGEDPLKHGTLIRGFATADDLRKARARGREELAALPNSFPITPTRLDALQVVRGMETLLTDAGIVIDR